MWVGEPTRLKKHQLCSWMFPFAWIIYHWAAEKSTWYSTQHKPLDSGATLEKKSWIHCQNHILPTIRFYSTWSFMQPYFQSSYIYIHIYIQTFSYVSIIYQGTIVSTITRSGKQLLTWERVSKLDTFNLCRLEAQIRPSTTTAMI